MLNLNDKQVVEKIDNFFPAFEKAFGHEITPALAHLIISGHLMEKIRDYTLKYLGDFNMETIYKIEQELNKRSEVYVRDSIKLTGVQQAKPTTTEADSDSKPRTKAKSKRKTKRKSKATKKRSDIQDNG